MITFIDPIIFIHAHHRSFITRYSCTSHSGMGAFMHRSFMHGAFIHGAFVNGAFMHESFMHGGIHAQVIHARGIHARVIHARVIHAQVIHARGILARGIHARGIHARVIHAWGHSCTGHSCTRHSCTGHSCTGHSCTGRAFMHGSFMHGAFMHGAFMQREGIHARVIQQFRISNPSSLSRFHEAYHQCQLPRNRSTPYAVSLISDKCGVADNLLKVIHYPSDYQPEVNFTVCVSPVNRHYDNYHQLVENIEVNRMFGAQRFVIYNYSTGSNFARYLASYVDDGIVEVQPWQVPVVVEETVPAGQTNTEIHYYGQVGALNDCLYRNMYRSRFIVYTDLDEMIVPREHRNWLDMLGSLSEDPENVASYIFKNTFFRSDWNVDRLGGNNSLAVSLQLKTLLVTEREQAIWPWFQRSKIIVNPRKVGWVGVHMIMTSIPGSHLESLNVRSNDALLHHYRLEWNEPQTRVLDRSMHRFTADIIARVSRRHEIVRSKRKTK